MKRTYRTAAKSRVGLPLFEKLSQQSLLLGDSRDCSRFVRPPE